MQLKIGGFFMVDLGTDILRDWSFTDGDLNIVSDTDNLIQSIQNRLSCPLNSMDVAYLEYGSVLWQFLGWRRNDTTLQFIKNELIECLKQDPRIINYSLNLEYTEKGLEVHMDLNYGEETNLELSVVIDENNNMVISDGD